MVEMDAQRMVETGFQIMEEPHLRHHGGSSGSRYGINTLLCLWHLCHFKLFQTGFIYGEASVVLFHLLSQVLGVFDWSGNNPVPPELLLLPYQLPFHPGTACFLEAPYSCTCCIGNVFGVSPKKSQSQLKFRKTWGVWIVAMPTLSVQGAYPIHTSPRVYIPCTPTKNYDKKIVEKFIHILPIVLHLRVKSHLQIHYTE